MMHSKNHNNKSSCDGHPCDGHPIETRWKLGQAIGVDGFTLVETVMAMAITALVITPIFITHGIIFQHVSIGANQFDCILWCKALFVEARQKQDPDAQEFTLDKPMVELDATCTYSLDKAVDQKSSLASLPGLHKESVTINWLEDGKKKQERLVTFIYKKPEQKKS